MVIIKAADITMYLSVSFRIFVLCRRWPREVQNESNMTSGPTTISQVYPIDNMTNGSFQTTHSFASICFLWMLSIKVVVDVTFPRIDAHTSSQTTGSTLHDPKIGY